MEVNKNFSYELSNVLNYMVDTLGVEYPTEVYGSEYLIVSMLDNKKCHANILLDNCLMSDSMAELRNIYISYIEENVKPVKSNINGNEKTYKFSDVLNDILKGSEFEAKIMNSDTIGSEHVLLSILNPKNQFKMTAVFNSMNVTYAQIMRKCEADKPTKRNKRDKSGMINSNGGQISVKGTINSVSELSNHEYIDKYTDNITKMVQEGHTDTLVGREDELNQIIKVFARRRKNNAILVGPTGCGKSQIVNGLAERILNGDVPSFLADKQIVRLNIMELVSGTNFRGMLEDRVDNLFKELKKSKKHILFLDDIHTMLRSGSKEKDTDISGLITQILTEGSVQVIAATNNKEYRNTVEINAAVQKKFQRINVEPNTHDETVEILNGTKQYYETYHNVKFTDGVIDKMVTLAERYVTNSSLPDSAFDVMDTTGAYVSLKKRDGEELIRMKKRLNEIEEEKADILNRGEFEKVDAINLEEESIKRLISEIMSSSKSDTPTEVNEDDVSVVISEMTKVPITRLNVNDKKNISEIDKILKNIIIGQDDAVDEICKSIKRNRVGLGYKGATKGTYMLIGNSGVGKTYLAKNIALQVYGDEKALIRLDMSEYSEKSSVAKLYGSSPGYVGFENGGQLTEAVKNKPYSVILLDEIEKADPEVYNVFLQLFDEGRLTDSSGQLVNFKNCIVIMTSNVGTKQAAEMGAGIGFSTNESENKRTVIEKQLKRKFPPEFLNRVDKIVYFKPFDDDNLKKIVKLEIGKFVKRLNELKYDFTYDDSVVDYIFKLSKGQSEYGARPIVRIIQEEIEDNITDLMLKDEYEPHHVFSGTCMDGKVTIK